MMPADLSLTRCGSPEHEADLEQLAAAGIPVPHEYASWCLNDSTSKWYWCRIENAGVDRPVGFAVKVQRSRALPGTRIAEVPRVGRTLHAPVLPVLGQTLTAIARRIPRLQRLDIHVFDEQPDRRQQAGGSIVAEAGATERGNRSYVRTLRVPLPPGGDDALLAALRPAARKRIASFQRSAPVAVRPITGAECLDRLQELCDQAFARTGAHSPPLRFEDVMRDTRGRRSILLGTFLPERSDPQDLVAFLWCRLHGDHVTYDTGGSERSPALRNIDVSYPLIWEMLRWGAANGAQWADLGGVIAKEAAADHPTAGISAFKRRFSNLELEVASEFRIEPHPALARAAEAARWLGRPFRRAQ